MRIVLFANTDWFLFNFKRSLAQALRQAGHEVVLLCPPGAYVAQLQALGYRCVPFALSRSGVNPLAEFWAVIRLWRLYRAIRPDVVHHFTIKCVIYGSLAARLAGVARVVNSITGLGFALLAHTLKARLIRPVVVGLYRIALAGSEVLFQNQDNLRTLDACGALRRARPRVVPGDGIDIERFQPPAHEPAGQVVLMMGRLLTSKGVADYVAAAALVRQRLPQARFLLAGEPDPGNPECVDAASLQRWKQAGQVEFLGQCSDVLDLIQGASVVVLASTQGEGMPRALLEGAACARPLVATDVPGSRELVSNEENGLLVPPNNPQALADAVCALLGEPARAQRLGAAGRRLVEMRFSDEQIAEQTFQAYGLSTYAAKP